MPNNSPENSRNILKTLNNESIFIKACKRQPTERTPIWIMRQAGRYLPEYRAIREKHAFFEVAHTPELCAEVTLQPVRRHGVDAAIDSFVESGTS